VTRLSLQDATVEHFTFHDGVIHYKNRIWLPTGHPVIVKNLDSLHASPVGGHFGILVNLCRVKGLFYWKNLKASVRAYIQECVICQRVKPDRAKYPGLLAPLPVPDQFWQMVTMDFIDGLPRSGRFNSVLVVVDKLSRYAHFVGLAHPYTVSTVVSAYMDNVHKLHGMP
jgi:hypothetical protein